MRIDFSDWTQRILSVEYLKLDINNPRFSYFSDKKMNQTEIVKFLIERFDVYELAKSIAADGYLLNEEPIVCKEGDTYVVLEGNRRVAACKILLNPHKYLSTQRAQNLLKFNFHLPKLSCHIAPSRKSADILIYRRHTVTSIKRWETVNKDAHLYNLFKEGNSVEAIASMLSVSTTEVRKALRRYNIYQYIIQISENNPSLNEAVISDKFPITSIERLYDDKRGLDFLGIAFGPNGEVNRRLDVEEFNNRLTFITEEVASERFNSRIFNAEPDKKEYIDFLYSQTEKFDFSKDLAAEPTPLNEGNVDKEQPKATDIARPEKKQTAKKTNKLFEDKDWVTGIKRIDDIFRSLKKITYTTHTDVIAISLRCYLDMIVYEFLKKKDCLKDAEEQENAKKNRENDKLYKKLKEYLVAEFAIGEDEIKDELRYKLKLDNKSEVTRSLSLRNMLQYITSQPSLFPDNRERNALEALLKGNNNGVVDLQGFNMLVHNQHYHIETSKLESTVVNLLPLLEHINDVIIGE